MSLLERAKLAPESMTQLEKLLSGFQVALLGMGIVFLLLLVLYLVINRMGRFFDREEPGTQKQEPVNPVQAVPNSLPAEEEDPEVLVALITAAIAASLQTSTHAIVVKQIAGRDEKRSAWASSGR